MKELIKALNKASGVPIERIEKHFDSFFEKINPDMPLDLEYLQLEFLKLMLLIKKEEENGIHQ